MCTTEISRDYTPARPPRVKYAYRDAGGCAATEAPRGWLYHRYAVDADGKVLEAKIIPPTSQNQARIEADLRDWIPRPLSDGEAATSRQCENLVRCYDPCISCSTHFLNGQIEHSRNAQGATIDKSPRNTDSERLYAQTRANRETNCKTG